MHHHPYLAARDCRGNCRDFIEPSTACLVHGNLTLPAPCMNLDVGNACLAFFNGMEIVGNMIELGQIDYGMVVDGESSRFLIESTIERLKRPETDSTTFREEFASLAVSHTGKYGFGADFESNVRVLRDEAAREPNAVSRLFRAR